MAKSLVFSFSMPRHVMMALAFALSTSLIGAPKTEQADAPSSSNRGRGSSSEETSKSADQVWRELDAVTGGMDETSRRKGEANWSATAEKARQFKEKFPNDFRAIKARKLEIISELNVEQSSEAAWADLEQKAKTYLQDQSALPTDRFDVSALSKEVRLSRSKEKRDVQLISRLANARNLITEFPEDARGYGYLLAVAKGSPEPKRQEIAGELLRSTAPEKIKAGAQRLIDQRKLVGQPLRLAGIEPLLFQGKPLVIYTWTVKRPDILKRIGRLAESGNTQFIGINLDQDSQPAKALLDSIIVPGRQLYEPAGLEGAIASQLHLTMNGAIYLINAQGVVCDVNGHQSIESALAQITMKGGAR